MDNVQRLSLARSEVDAVVSLVTSLVAPVLEERFGEFSSMLTAQDFLECIGQIHEVRSVWVLLRNAPTEGMQVAADVPCMAQGVPYLIAGRLIGCP
jgi:hypothetical protein